MSARRERKVVTVLFADLVGFTSRAESLDPEDVEAILGPYHERLRSELERFGGTVEKFIGDAVMALFGAPLAHEDDPERAVRAALAIRDWARGRGRARGPDRDHDRRGARLARRAARGGRGHGLGRRRQHGGAPPGGRSGQRHPRRRDDLPRDRADDRLSRGRSRRGEGQGGAHPGLGRRSRRAPGSGSTSDARVRRSSAASASCASSPTRSSASATSARRSS